MLLSIAYILVFGMLFGWVCKKIRIPPLFGMIIAGILLGPHVLGLLDEKILSISTEIRRIALIIILIRAGLKLSVDDLKKVGRPAVFMCFVPAACEIGGMLLLAPKLLGMSLLDAAILGAVVAAVSPAVVVPKMIHLIDNGYGTGKAIPQMILAGASVDDVFVIVLFTTFTGLATGGSVEVRSFVNIPISIVLGIGGGLAAGLALWFFFTKAKLRNTVMALILLTVSFGLNALEDVIAPWVPFAALLAIMSCGLMIRQKNVSMAKELSGIFDKLWIAAEVFLFVLVGASVAIDSALQAGPSAILLLFGVLVFRMAGVLICMLGTKLNWKERMFCMLAYTPKATVQAAIGGLPLAMGLASGQTILTVSVIAILLTAPLGAFAIDLTHKKWLQKEPDGGQP